MGVIEIGYWGKNVSLSKISKRSISNSIMFTEKIKQLREERQMPQRVLAAALLNMDGEKLLVLWIAEQIVEVLRGWKVLIDKVFIVAQKYFKE